MSDEIVEQARQALARQIPAFATVGRPATITRLGGLTNLVFKVEAGDGAIACACPARAPRPTSTARSRR